MRPKTIRLDRRQLLTGLVLSPFLPLFAAGKMPARVASLDWALAETMLALGHKPIAIVNAASWNRFVVEPPLPPGIADLGLSTEINFELLASLKPDLIFTSPMPPATRESLHISRGAAAGGDVLDEDALELALRDLLARHESLRTLLVDRTAAHSARVHTTPAAVIRQPDSGGFPATERTPAEDADAQDDAPRQVILPLEEVAAPLRVVACSPEALAEELAAATAHGFDLATEIPFRATLFRLGTDDHALLLVVHHSAADGWSITPLLEDLAAAYAARRQGHAPEWTPLAVQYADYTLWQRELLGLEDDPASPLARQIRYWTGKLADLPVELALPANHPRPLQPTYTGGTVSFAISAELHGKLEQLCRRHGVTLFMLLEAPPSAQLSKHIARRQQPNGVWRDLAMAAGLRLPDHSPAETIDAATIFALAKEQSHILGALPFRQLVQMGAVMANNSKLMSRSTPPATLGRFEGDILLYGVTRRAPDFDFQTMDPKTWGPYCTGAVRTITMDSTHNRMFSPDALKQIGFLPL